MLQSFRSKDTAVSSLFSTVKKSKQANQLHHAKSYDDIFTVQQLQPYEVKILLNNDKSLKNIPKINEAHRLLNNPYLKQDYIQEKLQPRTSRQSKQTMSQVLQQSVKRQNLLIKKNLFDPFKYFGSSGQLSNIHESTRHHQSRLEAMFSQNNSPMATDNSATYRKKSPLINNAKKKINLDVNRISNSVLIAKLEKLTEHERKVKESSAAKIRSDQKNTFMNSNDKENQMPNQSLYESHQKQKTIQKYSNVYQQHVNNYEDSKKYTQNYQDQSICSIKKMSIENKSAACKSNYINCSPKSYVKDAKQKYLKMNLNSLQKVRLKLKLTSSKN